MDATSSSSLLGKEEETFLPEPRRHRRLQNHISTTTTDNLHDHHSSSTSTNSTNPRDTGNTITILGRSSATSTGGSSSFSKSLGQRPRLGGKPHIALPESLEESPRQQLPILLEESFSNLRLERGERLPSLPEIGGELDGIPKAAQEKCSRSPKKSRSPRKFRPGRGSKFRPKLGKVELARKPSWSMDHGVFKSGDVEISPTFIDRTGLTVSEKDFVRLWTLGKGQNRSVWAGIHLPTFKLVAIKTCDLEHTSSRHQILNELRTLSAIQHPNVLQMHGAHIADSNITVVLELMNGGSMGQYVKNNGPLTEEQLACVALSSLRGLESMHRASYIHGDIKPDNLLLNTNTVKLSDFGLAKILNPNDKDQAGDTGTQVYMAPEQHLWKRRSFASDVWSFGLTMMFLVTGREPFESKNYWELLDKITESEPPTLPTEDFSGTLRNFISQCVVKDPQKRLSAKELLSHPFLALAEESTMQTFATPCMDAVFIKAMLDRLNEGSRTHKEQLAKSRESKKQTESKTGGTLKPEANRKEEEHISTPSFLNALVGTIESIGKALDTMRFSRMNESSKLAAVNGPDDITEDHLKCLIEDQLGHVWDPKIWMIWEACKDPSLERPSQRSDLKEAEAVLLTEDIKSVGTSRGSLISREASQDCSEKSKKSPQQREQSGLANLLSCWTEGCACFETHGFRGLVSGQQQCVD